MKKMSDHALLVPGRLRSVDVFRGTTIAAMLFVDGQGWSETYTMVRHSHWNGLTLADSIAPCFMWIVVFLYFYHWIKELPEGMAG
jgi:predicted acyltransferase